MNESKRAFPNWLPLLILAITIALLFYRLLIGEVLFWGLPALQFVPWRTLAQSELSAGRFPLWNPFNGGGAPLIANYQSAVFYPPNLLTLPIPGAGMIGWLGMLHLLWAGVGMWAFLGALGCNAPGRGVGAIAFALNTAVVARFGTTPMVDVSTWLPWLMFGMVRLITRPNLFNLAVLALFTALILLAGHAQWAFYSLALTGVGALYLSLRNRSGLRPLVLFAGALILGAALAAIQLAPTAELQRQSQRSEGADETFALNYSYETPLLITLFNPNFFGNPGDGSYQLNGVYFEMTAYTGMFPLIVALATILQYLRSLPRKIRENRKPLSPTLSPQAGKRSQYSDGSPSSLGGRDLGRGQTADPLRRWIPFFTLVIVITLLFAFGRNSPLYLFLFRYVPTFNLFQAPVRWLLLMVFGISTLAGIGLTLWRVDRFYWMRSRLMLTAAAVVTVLALVLRFASESAVFGGLLELGLLLTISAILLVGQPRPDHPRWHIWAIVLLMFVAGDLLWANRLSNPTINARFYDAPATEPSKSRTFRTDKALEEVQFGEFLRFKDYRVAGERSADYRAARLPNMNILEKLDTFNTFEPLRPAGIEKFTKLLNEHPAPNLFLAAGIPTAEQPDARRFWFVPTVVGTQDAFKSMSDPTWNPATSAFLEGDAPTFRGDSSGQILSVRETPQAIEMQIQTNGRVALVMADTWYPGWRATVNGENVPIYRANGAFRAVIIPAATTQPITISLLYDPPAIKIGAALSLIAAIVLLMLLVIARVGLARQRQ